MEGKWVHLDVQMMDSSYGGVDEPIHKRGAGI